MLIKFSTSRDWRDPSWQTIASVQNGVSKGVQAQRSLLFGSNLIDIEGKSTASLLIDDVCVSVFAYWAVLKTETCVTQIIHPFYVFQIASIILWSLDDYYYYAFCIALISAISIMSTLVETKQVRTIVILVDNLPNVAVVRLSLVCERCRNSCAKSEYIATAPVSCEHCSYGCAGTNASQQGTSATLPI